MIGQLRSAPAVTPFFLPSGKGNLFCNLYDGGSSTRAGQGILFFPPFAEEMNKSRWIVAEQARRFSAMGYVVVVPDLYGTGDSEGDFGEASWEDWHDDINHVVAWFGDRGINDLCFWGLRLGALLALDCSARYPDALTRLLFWQPVLNGRNYLTQFLRLKVAADMFESSRKTTTGELRDQLESGGCVEVAGYQIAPELALSIDELDMSQMLLHQYRRITWLELLPGNDRPVPVMTRNLVNKIHESGLEPEFCTVVGEPFWSLQELVEVPGLLENTCRYFPALI